MNGSNHEAGRQGLAPAADLLEAEARTAWLRPERLCLLCSRSRHPAASCEQERRIVQALEQRAGRSVAVGVFQGTTVCKDCCIAALDGHGCPWWVLCWRE
jgi:hypothetical protein